MPNAVVLHIWSEAWHLSAEWLFENQIDIYDSASCSLIFPEKKYTNKLRRWKER